MNKMRQYFRRMISTDNSLKKKMQNKRKKNLMEESGRGVVSIIAFTISFNRSNFISFLTI